MLIKYIRDLRHIRDKQKGASESVERGFMKNKRTLGAFYEQRVSDYLEQKGYRIIERNFYCRFGEIDLICRKNGYLVFVEVKYRSSDSFGTPSAAVDFRKQIRISNTASYYLYCYHYPMDTACRFDVAAVSEQSVQLIENAFPYRGCFRG